MLLMNHITQKLLKNTQKIENNYIALNVKIDLQKIVWFLRYLQNKYEILPKHSQNIDCTWIPPIPCSVQVPGFLVNCGIFHVDSLLF